MLLIEEQKSVHMHKENRPWGFFEQFCQNDACTVKMLHVKPKEELSLQFHHKRNEFWRVVAGNPIVIVGDHIAKAKPGDEFFIPRLTEHQLIAQDRMVEMLEISFGEFEEEDIVRIKDKYARV